MSSPTGGPVTGRPLVRGTDSVPRATVTDTVRVLARVLGPNVAQGVIARRPAVVRLAQRWQLDAGVVAETARLRRRYGRGPLRLRVPGRELALVLDAEDVHRVLGGTPDPFTPANAEKRAALGQFQPHGVLVSRGADRTSRRRVNEHALDTGHPVHGDAEAIVAAVRAEVDGLLTDADDLTWDAAHRAWRRAVRRVVLGEQARDDVHVHTLMDRLRARANWSFLAPRDRRTRAALRDRLAVHVDRAGPGSLAARLRDADPDGGTDVLDQIPQWLFAADPALMVAHRALALLAIDPDARERARRQMAEVADHTAPLLPQVRAAVLESARLWPTTPLILRDTTEATTWATGSVPAGAGLLVVATFLHRDESREPTAHRFAPENWLSPDGGSLDETAHDHRPLVPFSEGPASCPGQDLVLLMTSTWIAAVLARHEVVARTAVALDPASLPASLSPFDLAFDLTGR
ncbi:cytochrome P450 [Actinomycetospora soli]|uniref:cytochrome P450 n=1 Tax=Actinomycetospora soli TaxID=2893887 RepID=UPI001E2ED1F0|nr:cytochrome P450 [Actinomycetospora soli]MCD2186950.1 cytochrome P450 [Actinomycetospora soli]